MLTMKDFIGLDKKENRDKLRQTYADRKNKRSPGSVNLTDDTLTRELLSNSAARNLEECHKRKKQNLKVGPLEGVVADISQNPCKRHRAGPFCPSQQLSSQTAIGW